MKKLGKISALFGSLVMAVSTIATPALANDATEDFASSVDSYMEILGYCPLQKIYAPVANLPYNDEIDKLGDNGDKQWRLLSIASYGLFNNAVDSVKRENKEVKEKTGKPLSPNEAIDFFCKRLEKNMAVFAEAVQNAAAPKDAEEMPGEEAVPSSEQHEMRKPDGCCSSRGRIFSPLIRQPRYQAR